MGQAEILRRLDRIQLVQGQMAPNALGCAFLGISHWAFKQIEAGRSIDEVIRAIVEGSECYAVLGLALVLALEAFHVSETTLPLVSCQRLWDHDTKRLVQEPSLAGLLGLATVSLTRDQMEAKKYLDTRLSCKRGVRELAMRFAIHADKNIRTRFEEALARFPEELPYEIEEHRASPDVTAALKESAVLNAAIGDIKNYRQHVTEDDQVVFAYQSPVLAMPERMEDLVKTTTYLQKSKVVLWAMESLNKNAATEGIQLDVAISLARSCDNESMFDNRHEVGSHTDQSMIAALAACTIRFSYGSREDRNWALSVLARIEGMKEIPGTFPGEKNPWHPTVFAIHILTDLRRASPNNLETARRLMRLTVYPLEEISNQAFGALFWIQIQRCRGQPCSLRSNLRYCTGHGSGKTAAAITVSTGLRGRRVSDTP